MQRPSARRDEQHADVARLGDRLLAASPGCPASSTRRKYVPSSVKCVGVLAREHRVGLRAGGDQDRARRQRRRRPARPTCRRRRAAAPRPSSARGVAVARRPRRASGVRPSAKRMPSSSAFSHFLVVQRVRRAVDQPPAIGDRHAAPAIAAARAMRGARSSRCRRCALGADRARVREELVGDRRAPRRSSALRTAASPLLARPALRSAPGISRPAPGSRRATRSRCRSRSGRRRSPRPAGAPACWRSSRVLAAPVSCSAIRKSDAVRTPRARPFGMSSTVGLPAPTRERDVVEAQREGVVDASSVPPKRTPPNSANCARRSSSRRIDLQEVLVPAHGDAVLGDAAEARHHALVERLVAASSTSRIGSNGTRSPSRVDAGQRRGQRLDLQPVDADDGVAVVHQVMREREAGRAHARRPARACRVGGARQRPAQVERIPARQQRSRSRSPTAARARPSACASPPAGCRPAPASGRCRTSCSRCRCGGRSPRTIGLSTHDDRERADRHSLRSCSLWNSEIFSSSGQPASVTPNGDLLERRLAAAGRAFFRAGPCEHESLPCSWHQMQ